MRKAERAFEAAMARAEQAEEPSPLAAAWKSWVRKGKKR
jgi:hypothetical protein